LAVGGCALHNNFASVIAVAEEAHHPKPTASATPPPVNCEITGLALPSLVVDAAITGKPGLNKKHRVIKRGFT